MSHGEEVVWTFRRLRVTRHGVIVLRIEKRLDASGEHLVDVALVRHVEHEFVVRGVEHVVEGDRSLEETEVRADMAAMGGEFVNQRGAQLRGQSIKAVERKPADVSGIRDGRDVEAIPVPVLDIVHLKKFWVSNLVSQK